MYYGDDTILFAENEDDLQRLLFQFKTATHKLNMKIATTKTKSMIIAKNPIRCKLEMENEMIEQVIKFTYLAA